MLQRIRESLALVLLALLPFHALLVTVLTRIIAGPNQAPLTSIALWKEGFLAVILVLAFLEWIGGLVDWWTSKSTSQQVNKSTISFDLIDLCILLLLILSVAVTASTHGNWNLYLFGFRYDFVPLIAFLMLRRVPWSSIFVDRAMQMLTIVGTIVAGYALLTLILPESFFTFLGYSDLHSLYIPNRPIAAFQMIGETGLRRIQGPMSGPNQLGIWLLLPLAAALGHAARRQGKKLTFWKRWDLGFFALILTFSRAAWIAAAAMLILAFFPVVRTWSKKTMIAAGAGIIGVALLAALLFPSVLLRLSSTRGHIEGPIEAVHRMIEHPFGMGLGMAGPASNRVSDACVLLRETDDPSWAEAHPNLCVFLGDTQVQPVDRACSCPFLPENWYLQIGVEMGWIGFILYLIMIGLVMRSGEWGVRQKNALRTPHAALQLAFIGVATSALFLHAFEDAAIAYTLWLLIAASSAQLKSSP